MTFIKTLAELAQEYGILVLVLTVIAYFIYMIIKGKLESKQNKIKSDIKIAENNNQLYIENETAKLRAKIEAQRQTREDARYEKLIDSINELTSKIGTALVHTPQEQDEDVDVNLLIQRELDELTSAHNATRSYYFRYHNGGSDVLGRGMLKMSMTVESCLYNNSCMLNWQRTPRSMFPVLYEKLARDGDYYISNADDIAMSDVRMYSILKDHNTKSAFFKAVKRQDGLIAGFIGIEIDHTIDVEEVKKDVSRKADRIAGVLLCAKHD